MNVFVCFFLFYLWASIFFFSVQSLLCSGVGQSWCWMNTHKLQEFRSCLLLEKRINLGNHVRCIQWVAFFFFFCPLKFIRGKVASLAFSLLWYKNNKRRNTESFSEDVVGVGECRIPRNRLLPPTNFLIPHWWQSNGCNKRQTNKK